MEHAELASSEHVVVLEIFCGTAGVSASLKQLGLDTVAVDTTMPKSPKALVTKLDFTFELDQEPSSQGRVFGPSVWHCERSQDYTVFR